MIHPGGTPPFMLQGYKGEDKLIKSWEKKYKTPIFTSGQNHVHAMRALGIKKFIGASYSALQNKIVIDYMTQAGFKVVSMEPIDVPFNEAQHIRRNGFTRTSRRCFASNKGADGIYIQGGAWHTESIVELLEQDFRCRWSTPIRAGLGNPEAFVRPRASRGLRRGCCGNCRKWFSASVPRGGMLPCAINAEAG